MSELEHPATNEIVDHLRDYYDQEQPCAGMGFLLQAADAIDRLTSANDALKAENGRLKARQAPLLSASMRALSRLEQIKAAIGRGDNPVMWESDIDELRAALAGGKGEK